MGQNPEPVDRDETVRRLNEAIDRGEAALRNLDVPLHPNEQIGYLATAVTELTVCVKSLRALVTGNADA